MIKLFFLLFLLLRRISHPRAAVSTNKISISQKRKRFALKIFIPTHAFSLESSCYDKLILFLAFVLFLIHEQKFSATKETAREWINLNATSHCVALCANWCEFLLRLLLQFWQCSFRVCKESSILITFEGKTQKYYF